MKVDILTLFPKMFENVLGESMLKIAQKKKKVRIKVHDLRRWAYDRHRTADDRTYGGGSGMVMKIEPVYRALSYILGAEKFRKVISSNSGTKSINIVLLTPKGKEFTQKMAKRLAKLKHLILICGHYEGIDERVRALTTNEISVGDYILTGGELPAMIVLDSVSRLIPGVLGGALSLRDESFENNLLEYPQYTRPRDFEGMKVPAVLLSGDHSAIAKWRMSQSLESTRSRRMDMFKKINKRREE
ncbi:MAG: tRNA (guanosine(37)-N1)-methyltransferase TrmD [Candidatus Omnitrophota bacterium]